MRIYKLLYAGLFLIFSICSLSAHQLDYEILNDDHVEVIEKSGLEGASSVIEEFKEQLANSSFTENLVIEITDILLPTNPTKLEVREATKAVTKFILEFLPSLDIEGFNKIILSITKGSTFSASHKSIEGVGDLNGDGKINHKDVNSNILYSAKSGIIEGATAYALKLDVPEFALNFIASQGADIGSEEIINHLEKEHAFNLVPTIPFVKTPLNVDPTLIISPVQ